MKPLSLAALATLSLLATSASAIPLDVLIATHGTIRAGSLVFSGFHIEAPPVSAVTPVGGGGDVDVVAVVDADGNAGLRFTGIDAKGKPTPWDSDKVKEMTRYAVYTVAVTDPTRNLHTAHVAMGPGSFTTNGGHVFFEADTFGLYVQEPQGFGAILSYAQMSAGQGTRSNPQTSPLPIGDVPSTAFGTFWDLQKGHGGKVTGARAVIDYVEMVFPLVSRPPAP